MKEVPLGLSEEDKEKWWTLFNDCTNNSPDDRPSMEAVQTRLHFLLSSLKGIIYWISIASY